MVYFTIVDIRWYKINDYLMERDGDEMVVYFKVHVMRSLPPRDCYTRDRE